MLLLVVTTGFHNINQPLLLGKVVVADSLCGQLDAIGLPDFSCSNKKQTGQKKKMVHILFCGAIGFQFLNPQNNLGKVFVETLFRNEGTFKNGQFEHGICSMPQG